MRSEDKTKLLANVHIKMGHFRLTTAHSAREIYIMDWCVRWKINQTHGYMNDAHIVHRRLHGRQLKWPHFIFIISVYIYIMRWDISHSLKSNIIHSSITSNDNSCCVLIRLSIVNTIRTIIRNILCKAWAWDIFTICNVAVHSYSTVMHCDIVYLEGAM